MKFIYLFIFLLASLTGCESMTTQNSIKSKIEIECYDLDNNQLNNVYARISLMSRIDTSFIQYYHNGAINSNFEINNFEYQFGLYLIEIDEEKENLEGWKLVNFQNGSNEKIRILLRPRTTINEWEEVNNPDTIILNPK